MQNGRVRIKPNVSELRGEQVCFADGSLENIDVIIYATGYQITFPFFDQHLINVTNNAIPLYHRVVPLGVPDLYFIGLLQPLGPIMPLAELQAKWVALLLTGQAALPDRATMAAEVAAYQAALRKRYVNSTRHTIQVDLFPYIRELEKEMADGRGRASRAFLA